jgi:hypothetical protein
VNVEQQFRVGMKVAAPRRNLRVQAGNAISIGHSGGS